jgi:hypothetical protein
VFFPFYDGFITLSKDLPFVWFIVETRCHSILEVGHLLEDVTAMINLVIFSLPFLVLLFVSYLFYMVLLLLL